MRIPFRSSIILLFLSSISVSAHSQSGGQSFMDDVRIVAGVSGGYTEYSFPAKLDHDIGFPSGGLTLAATRNRWQLALNGSFSLQDADVSEEEDVGKASREDIDLTLGYQFSSNWSAFVGYKFGETDIEYQSREDLDEGIVSPLKERYKQEGPYVGG
ncbi:MAG: hypothetical protein R3212_09730, partial [Xanthomonadales bacterium]|nr:hypothetical protein [Xanthomonadales bacterium]